MAKSPLEQIRVEIELAEEAAESLKGAQERGDWPRVGLNLSMIYESWHYSLLVAWRQKDVRSSNFLQKTLVTAHCAQEVLVANEVRGAIPSKFSFESANILRILSLPPRAEMECFPTYYQQIVPFCDRNLSVLLFERLTNRPPSGDWSAAIAALAKSKRAFLATETYATYGRIIDAAAAGDLSSAQREASRAAQLYSDRARDGFYRGGPATAGGGPANEFVVDYELAAVQRCFFNAPANGAEMHWWP